MVRLLTTCITVVALTMGTCLLCLYTSRPCSPTYYGYPPNRAIPAGFFTSHRINLTADLHLLYSAKCVVVHPRILLPSTPPSPSPPHDYLPSLGCRLSEPGSDPGPAAWFCILWPGLTFLSSFLMHVLRMAWSGWVLNWLESVCAGLALFGMFSFDIRYSSSLRCV